MTTLDRSIIIDNHLVDALRKHAEGNIAKHKANVLVYMNRTVGIGEHSDIIETLEKELDHMAKYHDQLEMISKYIDPVLSPYQDKHLP
jgi:hypothetical protein|tara:strand:+ start:8657 stop:8920 length:264 start_codon:yes stop_codon:yes gene_type:complete